MIRINLKLLPCRRSLTRPTSSGRSRQRPQERARAAAVLVDDGDPVGRARGPQRPDHGEEWGSGVLGADLVVGVRVGGIRVQVQAGVGKTRSGICT